MRHGFEDLVGFTAGLFTAYGVPEDDARVTATRLVEADFRGRTGHGLIRAVPYLDRIAAGGINVRPAMRVLAETSVSAQVDADNGLGQVAMTRATEIAGDKATEVGVAVVGTVHSNHAGAAGLYPLMLAERGLVGIYFAVANANGMPPWGGREPLLGTNPVAVAIPGPRQPSLPARHRDHHRLARLDQGGPAGRQAAARGLGGRRGRPADHRPGPGRRGVPGPDRRLQGIRPDDGHRTARRGAQRGGVRPLGGGPPRGRARPRPTPDSSWWPSGRTCSGRSRRCCRT